MASLILTDVKKSTSAELFQMLSQIKNEIEHRETKMMVENGWWYPNPEERPNKVWIWDCFGWDSSFNFFDTEINTLAHLCLLSEDELRYDFSIQTSAIQEIKRFLRKKRLHLREDERSLIYPPDEDIEVLSLSVRSYNCLKRGGILTVADLWRMTERELLGIRNLGEKSVSEIVKKLNDYGFSLKEESKKPDDLSDDDDLLDIDIFDEINDNEDDEEKNPFLLKFDSDDNLSDYYETTRDTSAITDTASAEPVVDGRFKKRTAEEQLEDLIGLEEVKQLVRSIVVYAEVMKKYPKPNSDTIVSNHMLFEGNPGTAKTTVARILARMLHEKGILEKPHVHEVGRADLIGRYTGQTAPKVVAAFDEAKGGILFIDEAYSLVDGYDGFGNEAITTIVQEMENRRSDTIVIVAGYESKMQRFLEANAGFASRIKHQILFPDYSEDEMLKLLEYISKEKGYTLADDVKDTISPVICQECQSGNSGNGRWVRNAVEKAEMNWARRISVMPEESITEDVLNTLLAVDFNDAETTDNRKTYPDLKNKQSKIIGFRCDCA